MANIQSPPASLRLIMMEFVFVPCDIELRNTFRLDLSCIFDYHQRFPTTRPIIKPNS